MTDGKTVIEGIAGTTQDVELNVHQLLAHAADVHGDQEVVTYQSDGVHRYTYRDLYARVQNAANALVDLGIGPGEVVAIGTHSTYQAVELLYAVASIGATPHFLNPESEQHSTYLVDHITANAPMDFVFLHEGMVDAVDQLVSNPDEYAYVTYGPDGGTSVEHGRYVGDYESLLAAAAETYEWDPIDEDTCVVMMSSGGTTGKPKAIAHSHRSAWLIGHGLAWANTLGPQDNVFMFPPLHHGVGWFLWAAAPIAGAKLVLPGPDTPDNFQEIMLEEDITFSAGVAALVRKLVDTIQRRNAEGDDVDLDGTWFLFGGDNTPTKLLSDLDDLGATSLQMYGGAETELYFVQNIQVEPRPREADMSYEDFLAFRSETVGYPVPGAKIVAVDAEGNEVPRDGKTPGRACVGGPWVSGYWKLPEKSESARVDGLINLDDLVTIDDSGTVEYRDRAQDAVERGREMIPTPSVEDALSEHPHVSTVAVIGVAHEEHGEVPVAIVEPPSDLEPDEVDISLDSFLEDAVTSGKIKETWIPERVIAVEGIPRAHSGKMDKVALREEYGSLYAE